MGQKPLPRPREQMIARAVEMHAAGHTLGAIGRDLSVSKKTARRFCLEGGCQMRKPGQQGLVLYPVGAAAAAGAPRGQLPADHPLQRIDDVIMRETKIIAMLNKHREIRMAEERAA